MLAKTGELSVHPGSGFLSGSDCFLKRCEAAEMVDFAVLGYSGDVRPRVFGAISHPLTSQAVVFVGLLVALVFGVGAFPEIFPAIVAGVLISMIYLLDRPFSRYDSPCEMVRHVSDAVDFYLSVSLAVQCAGLFACVFFVYRGMGVSAKFPLQDARRLGIIQDRSNVFGVEEVARVIGTCFVGLSHSTLQKSFRLEAGLSVCSARPLRLYATGGA